MKQNCTICKKEFDLEEFLGTNRTYKRCQVCRQKYQIYANNFKQNSPEKLQASKQRYRNKNLDKIRERQRLSKAKSRKENYEAYKNWRKEYTDKNHERLLQYDKNRTINRPEYFLFSSARQRARKSGLEFTITEEDIKLLLQNTERCILRNVQFQKGSNNKAHDNSPSIDRIDSSKGYTKENIQIISYRANLIKSNSDLKLFEKIVNNLKTYKIETHNIDDVTMSNIIADRMAFVEKSAPTRAMKYIMLHLENGLINRAKKRATKKNLEFNIDENYLKSIWPLDNRCPLTGEKFVFGTKANSKYSATLDRIDNNLGYVKGNVQIISSIANCCKNNATINELNLILTNWKNASCINNKIL